MKPQSSLFRRTAFTVAAGLLIFQLASGLAIFVNLVLPLGSRSANDLADLLMLSARVWNELPEERRKSFATEMKSTHHIALWEPEISLSDREIAYPYIRLLRSALQIRLSPGQILKLSMDSREYFQVELSQGQHRLRFEFSKARIPPRPTWAVAWIIIAGLFATLGLSWLLAIRVTEPIAKLAEAARKIGNDDQVPLLPENGIEEFADLARIFNETSRQLQSRRENQTTLLAGVSHDLRTPLARMKMAIGMLAEQQSSPLLDRIERDITEMDQLIGAQLALARADEREQSKKTDIDALLLDVIEAAEAQAQAPGQLILRTTEPPCTAILESIALRRCVNNLLENALRYAGHSNIQVVRRRFKGSLVIGIRDHGTGIPTHMKEMVFRPFFRIETSRSRSTGGSGLGLAITRQITETHGWKIALKTRRTGGVCAWLLIPNIASASHSKHTE